MKIHDCSRSVAPADRTKAALTPNHSPSVRPRNPSPPTCSSLINGSSSKGNASSDQYLLMMGWTFVSMKVRTFLTIVFSSGVRTSAS